MDVIANAMTNAIDAINTVVWGYILIYGLLAVGIYFSIRLRFLQIFRFREFIRAVTRTPEKDSQGITPIQALTTSLASRVGTGNIAGVAVAVYTGGPGALFWMWIVALLGMATAYAESALAQLYKVNDHHGLYRGGPAFYISRGLKSPWAGAVFSVALLVVFGLVFNAVQANAISESFSESFGLDRTQVGVAVAVLSGIVIFGGIRNIARVAEVVVPFMAVLYMVLGLLVVGLNIGEIPNVLLMIFEGAFGLREFVVGGTMGAVIWGMKRGLLSNEAGMGTAPNAGATATISHPAKQGYVQALGVYFDTMLVCSVTAFIVLLSNPVYGDKTRGAGLTQDALAAQLGGWATHFLTFAIFLFAFSSVIGNYYYGESNIRFVTEKRWALTVFRLVVLGFVFFGAIASLSLLWTTADMLNAGMVIVNLVAVLWLSPKVVAVLKNYETQRKAGLEPIFMASDMPEIKNLAAWDGTDEVTTREFWAKRDSDAAAKRAQKTGV